MNERLRIVCIVLSVLHLALCGQEEVASETAKKGPYKAKLLQFRSCSKTSLPPAPNDTILLSVGLSNKTGNLHGNITIDDNDLTYLKLRAEVFIWENEQWNLIWRAPGWNCNRQVIGFLLAAMNVNYNRQRCSLVMGVYHFTNMNINTFAHFCFNEVEYGRLMLRAEVFDKKNTHLCEEFDGVVAPL